MNSVQPPTKRLRSVDTLRGFDMCWILGLGGVVKGVFSALPEGDLRAWLESQLKHVPWDGFHFYDLIFPLFLFLSGVSMAFSLPLRTEREGRAGALRHVIWRGVVLFLLGVFFNGGLKDGLESVRWMGVLQRIGLASACAGVLSLFLPARRLVFVCLALLIGYAALFPLASAVGGEGGLYEEGKNVVNWFDSRWLPGRKHDGSHDPEGLLSTVPAVATALLGVLCGGVLRGAGPSVRTSGRLVGVGLVLIAGGWAWSPFFPVIKKLWTSSFVLVAGGWSMVLLGGFSWLTDVREWVAWTRPFVWVGSNSIALYLLSGLGVFSSVADRFSGKALVDVPLAKPTFSFLAMLLLARALYNWRVLIRV